MGRKVILEVIMTTTSWRPDSSSGTRKGQSKPRIFTMAERKECSKIMEICQNGTGADWLILAIWASKRIIMEVEYNTLSKTKNGLFPKYLLSRS